MSKVAPKDPQGTYTVFVSCMKPKWIYLQRVLKTVDYKKVYGAIENAIEKFLIPVVTGWKKWNSSDREMLSLPVREGGMAIEDPTKSAERNFESSRKATLKLQRLIVEAKQLTVEDFTCHEEHMGKMTSHLKVINRERETRKHDQLLKANGVEKQEKDTKVALKRAKEHKTGSWLIVKPSAADHTRLTQDEFLDMTSLRYNKPLVIVVNAKKKCDFHGKEAYTLHHHALTCPGGGNRIHRHISNYSKLPPIDRSESVRQNRNSRRKGAVDYQKLY